MLAKGNISKFLNYEIITGYTFSLKNFFVLNVLKVNLFVVSSRNGKSGFIGDLNYKHNLNILKNSFLFKS